MKRSERDKLIKEWEQGNNYNNFNGISTECLEYIVSMIDNEVADEESGTIKRDTKSDHLITEWFYREFENRQVGIREKEYGYDLSEKFINNVEQAIKEAEEKGDNARTEKLRTILNIANEIRTGIEREEASKVIHNFRYMNLNGEKILVGDETLLSNINRFFDELGEQASAGYALNNSIYVYLTNAKDKDDLLKRMEVVSSKLEEYEKVKSSESMDHTKGAIGNAIKDFESGDILGR